MSFNNYSPVRTETHHQVSPPLLTIINHIIDHQNHRLQDLRGPCKLACFYLFSTRVPEASRGISARLLHLKFLLIRAKIGLHRRGGRTEKTQPTLFNTREVRVPTNQTQWETVKTAARWGALHLACQQKLGRVCAGNSDHEAPGERANSISTWVKSRSIRNPLARRLCSSFSSLISNGPAPCLGVLQNYLHNVMMIDP